VPIERVAATAGGLVLAATTVLYLVLIAAEGEDELGSSRVLFVAGSLAAAAAAALVGARTRNGARRGLLLSLAATAALGWGLLAIFSIGIVLMLAGIPIAIAAIRSLDALDGATAGSIAVAAVLVAAMDVVIALSLTA
jgi:hypothetical protein